MEFNNENTSVQDKEEIIGQINKIFQDHLVTEVDKISTLANGILNEEPCRAYQLDNIRVSCVYSDVQEIIHYFPAFKQYIADHVLARVISITPAKALYHLVKRGTNANSNLNYNSFYEKSSSLYSKTAALGTKRDCVTALTDLYKAIAVAQLKLEEEESLDLT